MCRILISTLLVLALSSASARTLDTTFLTKATKDDRKVKVELFVMSKCPDARQCEDVFGDVLAKVGHLTTLQIHYIGNPRGQFVTCKHGQSECDGNVQQLCMARYATSDAQVLDFIQCQNAESRHIGEPSLARDCAKEVEVTKAQLKDLEKCWSGYEGEGIMRGSMSYSSDQDVDTSCTMFIGGERRCVLDGGEWSDCEDGHKVADFVDSICVAATAAANGVAPEECADEDPSPAEPTTL